MEKREFQMFLLNQLEVVSTLSETDWIKLYKNNSSSHNDADLSLVTKLSCEMAGLMPIQVNILNRCLKNLTKAELTSKETGETKPEESNVIPFPKEKIKQ